MTSWTIGDITITRVIELDSLGGTRFILPQATPEEVETMPWLVPAYAAPDGRLRMAIQSFVIQTPTRRILVDTGLGNDKKGRAFPGWNNRDFDFLGELDRAGHPVSAIDTVLCTHLHVDHVGWNTRLVDEAWVPTFPQARYLFAEREYLHWRDHDGSAEQAAVFADSVKPVVDAGLVDLVAGDADLGEGVRLIPTPGHSPGHVSVLIQSQGQDALLTGDVAHHPCQMTRPEWSSTADSDQQKSAETRREVFARFADTPTLVIGGHFAAGHLLKHHESYRFEALD